MAKSKKETAEETLARLKKLYGDSSLVKGDGHISDVEVVPHKSIGMNLASAIGGIPRGKLIQVEGQQHVGKTTLIAEMIACFQQADDNVALFDFENAFDKKYGRTLGIKMDELLFSQPETMEEGYEIIIDLIKSGNFRLIIIDSLNMMVPKDKVEAEMTDKHVAMEARIHDLAIKKIKALLAKTGTTLVGISQYRDAIGAMGAGNDKKLAGANAWWFGCDFRIKITRFSTKKEDGYFINNIEITKNKCVSEDQLLYVYPGVLKYPSELIAGDKLLSFKNNTYSWEECVVEGQYEDTAYCVTSNSGRQAEVNGEHPFLTSRGFVNAEDLTLNDKVILTTNQPENIQEDCCVPPRLLAMLLSDGDITGKASLTITDTSHDFVDIIKEDIDSYYPSLESVYKKRDGRAGFVKIRNKGGGKSGKPNKLSSDLKKLDLFGKDFYTKFIPKEVINSSVSYRKEFLLRYLQHDGHIEKNSKGEVARVSFFTSSPSLREGIVRLLNSLNIFCSVTTTNPEKQKESYIDGRLIGKRLPHHTIRINSISELSKLFSSSDLVYDTTKDLVTSLQLRKKLYRSSKREILEREGKNYYEDKIKKLEKIGKKKVYSISVPSTQVFDCGGFITHNCGSPFNKEKWYCTLDAGTDHVREILEYGKEYGVIEMKGGGHYSYGEIKLGQGIDSVRELFNDNPELLSEIEKELYSKLNLKWQ